MLGLPSTSPAPDLPPEPRAALIIATAEYSDPELSQLRAPARDADDLASVLGDPSVGAFDVTRLINEEEAKVRRRIVSFLAARSRDDLVLIYISCHGILDARGRLYFATIDTEKSFLTATAIECSWLLDRLDECGARRQILILDCCFSGAFARNSKGSMDLDLEQRVAGYGRGRVVLTASRAGEYSFEGVPLSDSASVGSVFTSSLVEGIRTGDADTDGDGYITLDEAYAYAYGHVCGDSSDQTPQRWLYGGEGASLVLARNVAGITVLPAVLPEALLSSLDSPYPDVRIGAASTLGEWIKSDEPAKVLAAVQNLQRIADTDIPRVANAAREHLDTHHQALDEKLDQSNAPRVDSCDSGEESLSTIPLAEENQVSRGYTANSWAMRFSFKIQQGSWGWTKVKCVAFSPDGKELVSAGGSWNVRLSNSATGKQLRSLAGHQGQVMCASYSPKDHILATGSKDGSIKLWDLEKDRVRTIHFGSEIRALSFGPAGNLLAFARGRKSVGIYDQRKPDRRAFLPPSHRGRVRCIAFSTRDEVLASAGDDGKIRIWNPRTLEWIRSVGIEGLSVSSIAFSPDGTLIAAVDDNCGSSIWDFETGAHVGRFRTNLNICGPFVSVTFSPDGKLLAAGSSSGSVCLWDVATRKQVSSINSGRGEIRSVAFSPDSRLLAAASGNGQVMVWH